MRPFIRHHGLSVRTTTACNAAHLLHFLWKHHQQRPQMDRAHITAWEDTTLCICSNFFWNGCHYFMHASLLTYSHPQSLLSSLRDTSLDFKWNVTSRKCRVSGETNYRHLDSSFLILPLFSHFAAISNSSKDPLYSLEKLVEDFEVDP